MSTSNSEYKRQDPALRMFSSDFLVRTATMTDEQVGKLVRLLFYQHQIGHLSEEDVLYYCEDKDMRVLSWFEKDKNGKYYSPEVEHEINRRDNYCKSRSENAKGGKKANNRNSNKTPENKPTKDDSLPF